MGFDPTNGASHLGIIKSTTILYWAPIGLLMYEQSIEIGSFFQDSFYEKQTFSQNHIKASFIRNVPIA